MSAVALDSSPEGVLAEKRVLFVGKLGGMTRRQAYALVRQQGGVPVERMRETNLDLVVVGAEELPLDDEDLLSSAVREAAATGELEIINETDLWHRLGFVDVEQNVQKLYTPAMLADLLGVRVSIIRRWHRRGLIVPVREVHRLPYFDFQEVSTARQMARLLDAGATPSAIESKLAELARFVPDVARPLAQLSVIVEGRQLLLRQGEGLIEPNGQRRFDFDSTDFSGDGHNDEATDAATSLADWSSNSEQANSGRSISIRHADSLRLSPATENRTTTKRSSPMLSYDFGEMFELAAEFEEHGELTEAVGVYRTMALMHGPNADVNFRLAELLYRLGETSGALERYYVAVEIDEDFVEARANLGCVLEELGQHELAIAAFYGALDRHADYPDVHYHLARVLEECGQIDEAQIHWREFLALAPNSPWASEARERIGFRT